MAKDMVDVMSALGFERFCIAGHDRGGRVAYRTALEHPERVERLAVLDVLPIDITWERPDARLALGFWPWSLLAQREPLPEGLLGAAPEAVIDDALGGAWGSPAEAFDDDVREAYIAPLREPDHVHAICEEYRAAATIDREHDAADRRAGRRMTAPTLALWSAHGPLSTWYADAGGPLAMWRDFADDINGRPVDGGRLSPKSTRSTQLRPSEASSQACRRGFGGSEDPFLDTDSAGGRMRVSPAAPPRSGLRR